MVTHLRLVQRDKFVADATKMRDLAAGRRQGPCCVAAKQSPLAETHDILMTIRKLQPAGLAKMLA